MSYQERLRVPVSWWAIGMFFALSSVTAIGFYAGPMVAVVAGLATAAAVSAALIWFGNERLVVDAEGLHAGGAHLEWPYAGAVTVHDRAATRRRLGREADHAAWLVVRSFIPGSVEIAIDDADDSHPYWLMSTRRPDKLAAAIAESRAISRTGESRSPQLDCRNDVRAPGAGSGRPDQA